MPADQESEVHALLRQHLADPGASWSIGCFGAIAEFHRTPEEGARVDLDDFTVTTALGAIRLRPPRGLRPVPYELPSAFAHRWLHGLNFTLTGRRAAQPGRAVLTPLGLDRDAVRPQDRAAELFDLGLGAANVTACVRTADPALIARLRDAAGRTYAEEPALLADVVHASPHRVFLSAAGRIEVYQRIGTPAAGTPEGPHTHLLPKLLAAKRTHQATITLPRGHLPLLALYPANPVVDPLGKDRPFDAAAAEAFAAIVERWAGGDHRREKARALEALRHGLAPDAYAAPRTRAGRLALRVALRQQAAAGVEADVAAWRLRFDPTRPRPAGAPENAH